MSKSKRGTVVAILALVLLICLAGSAFALTNRTIEVSSGVRIVLNDVEFVPRDANGQVVEAFIYEGTTYLPVRAISEALGLEIDWDGATDSVLISAPTIAGSGGNAATASSPAPFNFETRTVTLNNGIDMPILGIGTFTLDPAQAEESVYHALMDGYRLIDTANAYMNERAVGRAIQRSGVPREEIFVTTKLWPSEYGDAARAIDDTLVRLDLEYIDLLLLHQPYGNYLAAYQAMEAAVGEGKVRAICLSNFYPERFDNVMEIATITPAVLQNERNPYFQQVEMQAHIAPYGTVLMDWFPLGGRSATQQSLFEHETILEIAAAHDRTAAQVILRWHLQSGGIAIPGSSNPDHILENITIFDFELTAEEMQRIAALDTGSGAFDFSNTDAEPDFDSFSAPMDFNDRE